MGNKVIADGKLLEFCFWKKRVFRNDSTVYSFRGILKAYFRVSGSKANKLIERIISLGYAEYVESEEGLNEDEECLNPDTTTIIKILV